MPIVSVIIKGGLGNQLFQIASAYGYARRQGGTFQLEHITQNGNRPVYWDTVLARLHPYLVTSLPSLPLWREPCATKYEILPQLGEEGLCLDGYLQSSRYFHEYADEIRALFQPSNELMNDIRSRYAALLEKKERVVVLHARRTDYITFKEFHGPLEAEYYTEAIKRVKEHVQNPIFLLCSDDQTYWGPEILSEEHHLLQESDIGTFALLQQFENVVMSNSTFIWWCVWMGQAKRVWAPSKWFGPSGPQTYEDIYESSWIRI